MAGTKRIDDPALKELLATRARFFGFFQAVQVIERMFPGNVPVGHAGPASQEGIRFRHDPRLIFQPGDVESIVPRDPEHGKPFTTVTTTFLGLTGTASPLPVFMSEDVLAAEASDEPSLREFYDLLHHRLISLFARAWLRHRLEAGHRADASDPATRRALAFAGVDAEARQPGDPLDTCEILALAPLLHHRSRSARGLELALDRFLPGLCPRVHCFVPRRAPIAEDQRALLGKQSHQLGRNLCIGKTVADRAGRFRVELGPMPRDTHDQLMPGGATHDLACELIHRFNPGPLEAELDVRLEAGQGPALQLATPGRAVLGASARIGTNRNVPTRSRLVLSPGRACAPPIMLEDAPP